MKNLLTLSAFMIFTTIGVYSQDATQTTAPEINSDMTFETETIEYGTIEQNSNGEREFVFTNTGTAPLTISQCKGTCGCTVPKCPQEKVLPGEEARIKVKYATNRLGAFNKGVKIYSNATPEGQAKTVYIKGNVLTPDAFKAHLLEKANQGEEVGQE